VERAHEPLSGRDARLRGLLMADLRAVKRRTLQEFRDKLIALPAAWKTKRLDALVPAAGLYVEAGLDATRFSATVRREADDSVVYQLPTLSSDQSAVFISEEEFTPADEAWQYLSKEAGGTEDFPGRGGAVYLVIARIDRLLNTEGLQVMPAVYVKKATWPYWVAGLTFGVGLITTIGVIAHNRR